MFKVGIVKILAISVLFVACAKSSDSTGAPAVEQNGVSNTTSIQASCLTNPNAANDPLCNQNVTSSNSQFCFTQSNCVSNQNFSPVYTTVNGIPVGVNNGVGGGLCSCGPGQELVFNADGLATCHSIVNVTGSEFYVTYRLKRRKRKKDKHIWTFDLNAGTYQQEQINNAGACNNVAKQLCTPGLVIDECSAQAGNNRVRCVPVAGQNYGFCGIPN